MEHLDQTERDRRARDIFLRAAEIHSPEAQAAYLEGACQHDVSLRSRVEALLENHRQDSFLENAAVDPAQTLRIEPPLTELPGTKIGRYKLLQQIGEGGMGVVYMAEQEEPVRRRVALKIIKLGMDTRQVVARFEAERQALALMDHPNIAKVLDGGATEAGRPYFVMELVQGVPITEFCDQAKLPAQERLKLFIQVCQAVQSAHQKGIIHRDLKPSNILVTLHHGEPMPKVIDFGIAKATNQKLTEKTLFTQHATMIGTPAYMSPEQAELTSMDIDTRSDIYSLGVLLYALLTGSTPFPEKRLRSLGYGEMQRVIREEEPERPSTRLSTMANEQRTLVAHNHGEELPTLSKLLKGDIDWIVMKCLEKDRSRRYDTANGLASDLKRHLNNEAVLARPPSAAYRARKFILRNEVAVAAVASIAVVLVLGVTVSTWQAVRATRSGNLAHAAQENEARQRLSADEARRQAEARELIARRRAYTSDMNLALQAWDEGNLARAQSLLATSRPEPGQLDLRGFEWRYLWKLCQDESRLTLSNFTGGINWFEYSAGAAFSADGKSLILGGRSNLKSLEIATQREQVLLDDPDGIWLPTFSPGGANVLATVCENDTIKLWDWGTRQLLTKFSGHSGRIRKIAFAPDGRTLASVSLDGTVKLWDLELKNPAPRILTKYSKAGLSLAFSPEGKYLVTSGSKSGNEKPIRIFNVLTGDEVASNFADHTSWVYVLAFSRDGQLLASAGGEGMVFIWDFASRELLYTLPGHGGNIYALAFSSDGHRLISGGADNTIRVWDLSARRQAFARRGHRSTVSAVNSLALSSDDKSMVSVAGNGAESQVKIWDLSLPNERDILPSSRSVVDVALSPDDKMLASVSEGSAVELWDAPSRQPIERLSDGAKTFGRVAFSPDGALLATGGSDRTVRLCDLHKREWSAVLTNEFPVTSMAFSLDGRTLAAAGSGLQFWDVASRQLVAGVEGKTDGVSAVAFSSNARHLATGDREGNVVIWDWLTRKPLRSFKPHGGQVRRVAFSGDGALLASGGIDPTVALLEVTAMQGVESRLEGHTTWVSSVAFTPDGRTLASTSYDGTIKLWNIATRQLVLTLKGHVGTVHAVVFSSDGNLMATAGADGAVRLWPAATFAETDAVEGRRK